MIQQKVDTIFLSVNKMLHTTFIHPDTVKLMTEQSETPEGRQILSESAKLFAWRKLDPLTWVSYAFTCLNPQPSALRYHNLYHVSYLFLNQKLILSDYHIPDIQYNFNPPDRNPAGNRDAVLGYFPEDYLRQLLQTADGYDPKTDTLYRIYGDTTKDIQNMEEVNE